MISSLNHSVSFKTSSSVSKTLSTPILSNDRLNRSFINSLTCCFGKKSNSPSSKIQSMTALSDLKAFRQNTFWLEKMLGEKHFWSKEFSVEKVFGRKCVRSNIFTTEKFSAKTFSAETVFGQIVFGRDFFRSKSFSTENFRPIFFCNNSWNNIKWPVMIGWLIF